MTTLDSLQGPSNPELYSPIGVDDLINSKIDLDPNSGSATAMLSGDDSRIASVHEFEQKIWTKCGFGDLEKEGYRDYEEQSRLYAFFDEQGEIHGVTSIFTGGEIDPPFMKEFSIWDSALEDTLRQGLSEGVIEELGTSAIDDIGRDGGAAALMWRLAFRGSSEKGVVGWGLVMEPNRVKSMNRLYGFSFEQIGDTRQYQGGECAPHFAYFSDIERMQKEVSPDAHDFFFEQPLNG